jgi:glycosyltransferase involved in cell wall biosynthesis
MITEPWGGSEELWAGAATRLAGDSFDVSASVTEWSPLHKRVVELANSGVEIWLRPKRNSLWKKAWRRATNGSKSDLVLEVRKLVAKRLPEIIIFSNSWVLPPLELVQFCVTTNLPFVSISQVNSDAWWIDDEDAERYRLGMAAARRCYFVSNANLTLAERQLGCQLTNAEVVSNPFNVDFNAAPPWPKLDDTDELRLACVARLEPSSKGQDVLLEAFGNPVWADRNWRLTLYGEGPKRDILERLALRFGIANRVTFAGHVTNVESIWATNHALVMPSRFEGLPLAMVEAMLCGRPVLATDVAGHSEIVEDGVTGFLADAPTMPALVHSLERIWAHRSTLELIGKEAAKRIRALVPADPVEIFTQKIKSVVQTLN